jgi:8-oxo-dGTP pyrophosphatase MutT (NUDIX family)
MAGKRKSKAAKGKPRGKGKAPGQWRHETSAGGLIWRSTAQGDFEVALVRPEGRETWVLPKGHVEKGETPAQAALREAREESGLEVAQARPLGDISYIFSEKGKAGEPPTRIFKRVHFFLMRCEGGDTGAHDWEIAEVAWLPIDQAIERASYKSERELIGKACTLLTAA